MKVYKFGGASVKNADGVRNLRSIVSDEEDLFVIVSAMGKTTNALERVFEGTRRVTKPSQTRILPPCASITPRLLTTSTTSITPSRLLMLSSTSLNLWLQQPTINPKMQSYGMTASYHLVNLSLH